MANEFIGLQMLVQMRDPPTKLKGTVSAVDAGTGLTLINVWRLDTNTWEPRVIVPADNIASINDISAASKNAASASPAPAAPQTFSSPAPRPSPVRAPAPAPSISASAFVDPAIVALGRRPGSLPGHQQPSDPPSRANTSEKREPRPAAGTPRIPQAQIEVATGPSVLTEASLKAAVQALDLESGDEDMAPETTKTNLQETAQKKSRRKRKAGSARNGQPEDPEASPQAAKPAGRGKGWRQTPMLQSTTSFQPFAALKKTGQKGRSRNESGWASEDVTDVQEMGDFDFEGGLAKFDKELLFEQMKKDDLVAEANRLVSHNRQARPKPGTAGGKNLHYTENVLEGGPSVARVLKDRSIKEASNDFWNSEADDGIPNGAERLNGRELGSRQGSRRGDSKVSTTRRSQSRKASTVTGGQGVNKVNSGPSHATATTAAPTGHSPQQGLYILPTNHRLDTVSALQMLNLENIAHNEIGLTEEMMTENAGRGIADVTLTALSDPAIQVRHAVAAPSLADAKPPTTVVVLAGNNKSGIRSVAAARHLRHKGVNVLVCVVGLERGERDLLEDMRQHLRLYRNLGGRVLTKSDLFEHLRKASSVPILTMDTPRSSSLSNMVAGAPPPVVTLILDALLGLAISFDELRSGDRATVYELITWANRNEAFALAVDVPSGIDPSSGRVSVVDGSRLYVRPRYVVSMGAPKRGLLLAMRAADAAAAAEAVKSNGGVAGAGGSSGGAAGGIGGAGGIGIRYDNDDNDDDDDDGTRTVTAGVVGGVGGGVSSGVGDGQAQGPDPDDSVGDWKLFLVDMGLGPSVWKKAGTKMRRGIDFGSRWVLEVQFRGIFHRGIEATDVEEEGDGL